YLIRLSPKAYNFIERILPARWLKLLNNYSSSTQDIQAESDWKKVIKSYITIAVTNGIILLGLMLVSTEFFFPFLAENIENEITRSIIGLVVTLGFAAPFLWALMAKKPNNIAYRELWLDTKYSRGPLLVLEISRNVVGLLLIGFWVDRLFSATIAIIVAVPIIFVVMFLFSKRIQRFYQRIEGRFL